MSETNFTRDTKLAACLCTLGIPLRCQDPIVDVRKGKDRIVNYYFESKSRDGVYNFKDIVVAWNDPQLNEKDPENIINYIKAAMYNREKLLDLINSSTPLGMIQKGDNFALVPLNSADRLKNELFKLL